MRRTTTLVLALGALVLAACGGADSSPHAAAARTVTPATSPAGGVRLAAVPWGDLPPTHPDIPSTRVPPRPDPAIAQAARPCRGSDLALKPLGTGAAAGTTVKNLRFSLATGSRPCAVSGRPTATLRTVEGHTVPGAPSAFTSRYSRPVLLTHRASALAQLVWPSACFAISGQAATTLTYAGRMWTVPTGAVSDTCDFGADRPLQSIGITRFFPPHAVRARRVTAYTRVRTRGRGDVSARLDRPVTFAVTLTAPTDLPLDPCPDYRLGASPGGGGRFGLNCVAVPYRDGLGRPYLPAGRPVRFELHLDPVEALQKYWWELIAPGRAPYAAGVITLR